MPSSFIPCFYHIRHTILGNLHNVILTPGLSLNLIHTLNSIVHLKIIHFMTTIFAFLSFYHKTSQQRYATPVSIIHCLRNMDIDLLVSASFSLLYKIFKITEPLDHAIFKEKLWQALTIFCSCSSKIP